MTEAFTAACVQLTSGPDEGSNVAAAGELIRRARSMGADLVLTPETTSMMELVAAADMNPVDEDLRNAGASAGTRAHLRPTLRAQHDVDFVVRDRLAVEQLLCPITEAAKHVGIDLDTCHPGFLTVPALFLQ